MPATLRVAGSAQKRRSRQAGPGGVEAAGGAGKSARREVPGRAGAARGGPGAGAQGGPFPPGSRTGGRQSGGRRLGASGLVQSSSRSPQVTLRTFPGARGVPGGARVTSAWGDGRDSRRPPPYGVGLRAASRSCLGLGGRPGGARDSGSGAAAARGASLENFLSLF